MCKFYYSVFSFIIFISSKGQQLSIKSRVFDSDTKICIPYVSVHISNTMKFRDTDEKGFFQIMGNSSDTLIISCIGYESSKLPVSKIGLNDSCFLIKKIITLNEIISSKPLSKVFGILNERQGRSCSGGSEAERTEIATLIEIPDSIKLYKISKIFIKGRNFKEANPVRLHIYGIGNNGLPGTELLIKEIIIKNNEDDNKTISIDVKDQGIFLEQSSFFVGIQWITSTKVKLFTGPEIFETFKVKKLLTYRRSLSLNNNQWYGWFKKSLISYPDGIIPTDDDPPINVLTSAEIEIFGQ